MENFIKNFMDSQRAERSASQMTLGKLISELEQLPMDKQIENICEPHSYRGYYADLAFEKADGTRTVGSLLALLLSECLGKTFYGYKGGDYYMDKQAPLWIAGWGFCGSKIIGIIEGKTISFLTKIDE